MVTLNFNIPLYRVRLQLAQKRGGRRDQFLTIIDEVANVRIGNRISRFARLVLEKTKIQKILGANLVGFILLTNTIAPGVSATAQTEAEVVALPAGEAPVITVVVRRYPIDGLLIVTQGYNLFHLGVDIDGVTGDSIYPVMNGKVEAIENEFFLGKAIRVSHENRYVSVYGHLDTIAVKIGQEVTTGTKLGEMGNTGRSLGDHLHFEAIKDGRHINPKTLFPIK